MVGDGFRVFDYFPNRELSQQREWMTAGAGLLHQEYHEEAYSKKGGPFEMVRLWVDLPASWTAIVDLQ
jgi:redox-sensitive bicupin YhaK (pirin superfamily)